jgi:Family of unknown function (DUF6281)
MPARFLCTHCEPRKEPARRQTRLNEMKPLPTDFVRVACACLVTIVALGGCAEREGQQASRDCSAQIRADGILYTSQGYTDREADKYSLANDGDCQDVGPDADGSVQETSRQVATWTFRGYPAAKVLGVRLGTGSFAVFVADSVAPKEREQIYEALAEPSR